jgi:hypothetical protein
MGLSVIVPLRRDDLGSGTDASRAASERVHFAGIIGSAGAAAHQEFANQQEVLEQLVLCGDSESANI